jgi:hypothetical protein
MVNFTPWLLIPQRKSPWYPLDRELDEPQNQFRHSGGGKNSSVCFQIPNFNTP